MLYLKSLTLSRFKSFKHAQLLFSKGFTCVVGPNGSGKSNICDSLLFVLGESSLKRLRVEKLESLISATQKSKKDSLAKAYVKVDFGGEENLEIIRIARADGKSAYKVNGKHMTRQETVEILKKYKMNVDDTNTITQGEISRMMDLSPKERRELIDVAAGIKEFENKKAESLKELDKVTLKQGEAKVILAERAGFLKDLEKEKEAAENFISLNARLKSLKYSILLTRESEVNHGYSSLTKEIAAIETKTKKFAEELTGLQEEIDKLSAERQQISKTQSESSISSSEESKKLEGVNNELATTNANIEMSKRMIMEKELDAEKAKSEEQKLSTSIKSNKSEIGEVQKKLSELEPMFNEKIDEIGEGSESRITEINNRIRQLEQNDLASVQNTLAMLNADLATTKNLVAELQSRTSTLESSAAEKKGIASEVKVKSEKLATSAEKVQREIDDHEKQIEGISREVSNIDSKSLELKEQRAVAQAREGSITDKLKDKFNEKDGFYGKVSQLCSYAGEYAAAIENAAGGRFDYFVVDSINTASGIITYLKKNDLGRATFIPIDELAFERNTSKEEDLSELMSLLKFDKKFKKVFEYIFNNTYLISAVEDAKKYGIGRHRYVTISGELVEQTGIVSGGSAKKRVSLASIENLINDLGQKKIGLLSNADSLGKQASQLRKDKALSEIELGKLSMQLSESMSALASITSELEKSSGALGSSNSKINELNKMLTEIMAKRAKITSELDSARKDAEELYNKTVEVAKGKKKGAGKEERERMAKAKEEYENLKIKKTSLQTENTMFQKRSTELEEQLEVTLDSIKDIKVQLQEKEIRREVLQKAKEELEAKIASTSSGAKKAYEKLEKIEKQMESISMDKGKKASEKESLDRQSNEIKIKISQTEMRLADIKAELQAYTADVKVIDDSIGNMEKESAVVNSKITELGNVNLKAPEIYDIQEEGCGGGTGKARGARQ